MSKPQTTTRDDITCPEDGELIPLDKFSVSKWNENTYFVHCPRCRVFHTMYVKVSA